MKDPMHQRDIDFLWHPYTEITAFEQSDFPIIERAEGVFLFPSEGPPLLDGIASWWCVNLGHSHPRLVQAIRDQARKLQHAILGGMSHPNAIALAERLAAITPGDLGHAFFAGDGASAIEAALKIALQYWVNIGERGRTQFICLADGYHGDTLGAIGVGYVEAFHKDFEEVIHPAHRADSPHCAQCPRGRRPDQCNIECFDSMAALIREHHAQTAAVIVEPLCQGAGGIRIYPDEYLRRLRALCDEYGLLLIADEIAVGFGRTGALFACERAGIVPDIMTIGKGMTGGYLPMSAALVRDRIYDSFRRDGDRIRTLYHGHTFCGNPITSAVALAALDVYEEERIVEACQPRIAEMAEGIQAAAASLSDSMALATGMIASIEFSPGDGGAARARAVTQYALDHGLFIRPLGPVIYLWPPLVVTREELAQMTAILRAAIEATGNQ